MNKTASELLSRISILIALMILLSLSSCFYTTKYIASYTVQNKSTVKNTNDISVKIINQLAGKYQLIKDSAYLSTDTLGFYGRPYHYFKFWFEHQNNQFIIKLNYEGSYGSRRNPPYRRFLQDINENIQANFFVIDRDIKETDNAIRKK